MTKRNKRTTAAHSKGSRLALTTGVLSLVLAVTAACDSPTQMLNGVMKMAGLTSEESKVLAEDFEAACDHFLACAAEKADDDQQREQFESMAQMCQASGVMVSVISVLGADCQEAARDYVACATETPCDELGGENSPRTACETQLDAMKSTCEQSGRDQVGQ